MPVMLGMGVQTLEDQPAFAATLAEVGKAMPERHRVSR
jgi:hypothetical protein